MDEKRQDDPLEPTYNRSVPIQDVALKTYWEQWMIEMGGERGSGRSVLAERYDNNHHHHSFLYYFSIHTFFLSLLS